MNRGARLPSAIYGSLEIGLNRYIASDDRALERCAGLAGKSLQVDFSDLGMTMVFVATGHGIQIMPASEGAADVRLDGKSTAFARIFFAGAEEGLTGGALRIEGDVGVAQQFARLFASVDFDIGDWLDARLGPVPAYFFGRGLRSATAFARRAVDTLSLDAAEYLREETRDVVGTREHARFAGAVDTLRDDADRLQARVRRLPARTSRSR